jgi:phage baseplate assembly protein W
MADISAREALTQAIRYWEPRRLLYNAMLVLVVTGIFVLRLPGSRANFGVDLALFGRINDQAI